MKRKIITAVLDVGGTSVKHALFMNEEMVPDSYHITAINEGAELEEILKALIACAGISNQICICMPGPMDYATGKSMMRHKFCSLFGVELKTILQERTGVPCTFIHDVVSFLAGVSKLGETRNAQRPAAVTLGTGLGYAYQIQGVIQKNNLGSPVHPLWNESFGGGILEDIVSGRGLSEQYRKITGRFLTAKELSKMASDGDPAAAGLFASMGQCLGQALSKRTEEDGIDAVILGGQVSKSADLFAPQMREALGIPVYVSAHIEDASLYGVLNAFTTL